MVQLKLGAAPASSSRLQLQLCVDADGTLEGLRKTACYINAGHYPCSVLNGWSSRQAYWAAANKCL